MAVQGLTREPTSALIDKWFRWLHYIGGDGIDNEVCRADEVAYRIAGKARIDYTCGCGQMALGYLPYDGDSDAPSFARVCAVCDAATEFPRFTE